MAVDAAAFKSALACFPSGVTVVTARDATGAVRGMTASAFCSLSLDPPLVLVCVRNDNGMDRLLGGCSGFAVHILGDEQVALSNRFAGFGQGAPDDLSDLPTEPAPFSGAPWLAGCVARLDCAIQQVVPGGDHRIYLGRVMAAESPSDRADLQPLLYLAGSYRRVGERR